MIEDLNLMLHYLHKNNGLGHLQLNFSAIQSNLKLEAKRVQVIIAKLSRDGYIHSFFSPDYEKLHREQRIFYRLSTKGKHFIQKGGYHQLVGIKNP